MMTRLSSRKKSILTFNGSGVTKMPNVSAMRIGVTIGLAEMAFRTKMSRLEKGST